MDNYPHPEADFTGFKAAIERQNKALPAVWNPISKRPTAWILTEKIHKTGGDGGFCVMC